MLFSVNLASFFFPFETCNLTDTTAFIFRSRIFTPESRWFDIILISSHVNEYNLFWRNLQPFGT